MNNNNVWEYYILYFIATQLRFFLARWICPGREPRTTDARERSTGAELRALLRPEDRQQRHRRHDTHTAEEH